MSLHIWLTSKLCLLYISPCSRWHLDTRNNSLCLQLLLQWANSDQHGPRQLLQETTFKAKCVLQASMAEPNGPAGNRWTGYYQWDFGCFPWCTCWTVFKNLKVHLWWHWTVRRSIRRSCLVNLIRLAPVQEMVSTGLLFFFFISIAATLRVQSARWMWLSSPISPCSSSRSPLHWESSLQDECGCLLHSLLTAVGFGVYLDCRWPHSTGLLIQIWTMSDSVVFVMLYVIVGVMLLR